MRRFATELMLGMRMALADGRSGVVRAGDRWGLRRQRVPAAPENHQKGRDAEQEQQRKEEHEVAVVATSSETSVETAAVCKRNVRREDCCNRPCGHARCYRSAS